MARQGMAGHGRQNIHRKKEVVTTNFFLSVIIICNLEKKAE